MQTQRTRICNDAKGTFPNSIQCGYHGWTYALDGSLVGAPHMNEVENFDKKNYGLHSVPVNVWEDLFSLACLMNPMILTKFFLQSVTGFQNGDLLILKHLRLLNTKLMEIGNL